MTYNSDLHHRRSIRLSGHDYASEGAYFITICAQNREHFFGEIRNGIMALNEPGIMIDEQWHQLKNRFENIALDEYVLMPNHFHGILWIINNNPPVRAPLVGAPLGGGALLGKKQALNSRYNDEIPTSAGAPTRDAPAEPMKTMGEMIGAFKSITTNEYIDGVKNRNWEPFDGKLWQRNFYEHIIRNEGELNRIRQYIRDNPRNWGKDKLNR